MITIKEIGKLTGLSIEEVNECINELKEENLVLTYEMKKISTYIIVAKK